MMSTTEPPQPVFCVVEFVPGSRVHTERPHVPGLAVVQNGPPGTFVTFVDGRYPMCGPRLADRCQ